MTPELWERLKPLFEAALEKPREQREEYVAKACGEDEELRGQLMSLVSAHRDSPDTIDQLFSNIGDRLTKAGCPLVEGELLMGRFEIRRRLGSGGMGDVYEVEDRVLGRIALKTIRAEFADHPNIVLRFKNEVQMARKVVSRHVCRVHEFFDVSAASGNAHRAFFTMEFLDGVTLADRLRESGPMAWRDAWEIGIEIASGLEAIHQAGIIHRDVKSRNVMLASRNGVTSAVVMDFGLAREFATTTASTRVDLTNPGAILGTPAYMAPEQFSDGEVGPWTDVYAMGVVLYELLTGTQPYSATTPAGAAVLRARRPRAASSIQPGVPHFCDDLINTCLEYEPQKRYQSMSEVAEALAAHSRFRRFLRSRWIRPLGAMALLLFILVIAVLVPASRERLQGVLLSSREKHIAFLPVLAQGDNPGDQVLGDGVMDSLAGQLSNMYRTKQALWVVPASEVRSRKVADPASALREFGATIVVKGSFERSGDLAHLRLELIDPRKMREIGFTDIESKRDDLAALQEDALTSLGRLMNISVDANQDASSVKPASHAAYEDYLTALGYIQRFDKPGNLDLALAALESALNTDKHFALGYARLAQLFVLKYEVDGKPEWLARAREYAKHAAAIDDRVPLTFVALGNVHEDTGDHELAVQEFQHALDLDPRNTDALAGMALAYRNEGRNGEAEDAYRKSSALRPGDWTGYNTLGNFYDFTGRHQEAIEQFQKAIALTPDNSAVYANLGAAYLNSGDTYLLGEAEKALKQSIAITPTYQAYAGLCSLYQVKRLFRDSAIACQKGIRLNDQSYDLWYGLTTAYEWMHEEKSASAARQKAIRILQEIVQMNPQNSEAQATLAALVAKNGAQQKAFDGIRISLALSPTNSYVLTEVADAYEALGDREQAVKSLRQAVSAGAAMNQLSADPELQDVVSDPLFKKSAKQ